MIVRRVSVVAALAVLAMLGGGIAGKALHRRGLERLASWSLPAAVADLRLACRLGRTAAPCLDLAHALQMQGNLRAAAAVLERLERRVEPETLEGARLADLLGVNAYGGQHFDVAVEAHARAADLARRLGSPRLEARASINWARALYYGPGRLEAAREHLTRARRLGAGDRALVVDAERNLAVVTWWEGDGSAALASFRRLLERYRELAHRRGEAITLSNIALIHGEQGDYLRSLDLQRRSLAIKTEIGDLAGASESHLYLGSLFRALGNRREAHRAYSRSIELSRGVGYTLGLNEGRARLAYLEASLGRYDEAIAIFESLLDADPPAPAASTVLGNLGVLHAQRGDFDRARRALERAMVLDRQTGGQATGHVLLGLAEVALAAGEPEAAAAYYRRAEAHYGDRDLLIPRARLALFRAHLAEREGRRRQAVAHRLEVLEDNLGSLGGAGRRLPWGDVEAAGLWRLLFPSAGPAAEDPWAARTAFEVLERLRHRVLRDLPGTPRLSGSPEALPAGGPGPAGEPAATPARGRSGPADLAEIQAALDDDTVILAYLFAGERVVAITVTRRSCRTTLLDLPVPALRSKVKLLRDALSDPTLEDALRPVAADLHRHLIGPLVERGAVARARRWAVLPYGFLHELPFAALLDGAGPADRFLVEDRILFYPLSATHLVRRERDTPELDPALVVGYDSAGPDALRFAEAEARAVHARLGGELRVGGAATRATIEQRATRAGLLHVAAHAVSVRAMPQLTHLRLAPTDGDGRLTVRDVLDLELHARLVNLAGCRSGQSLPWSGNALAEHDRFGLAEAFLHAGARAVLASRLPIEDRAAARFSELFYRRLDAGGPALALAETQRALLDGAAGPELAHPRSWAPFVLLGGDP